MTKTDELIKEYEKIDEEEINKPDYSCLTNNNITQYKSDLGFKTLVQGLDQGLYVIPKYQRKFIWLKQQVEELAVSLIRGLPIPPIYVCRNEKNKWKF
ncbi:DUF262 domain-containing protein [Clostridium botulinum]|uniref:DUF262 domain-containing protein n=1 Tax=Clostridium TaxID=1485 RepID=UPI0013FC069D|nr:MULTISPECIES: DUF262 domain-containing protein [Clostridium]MCS6132740.1 DUF262 domain-containing protein [Clostridium botulinum]NFL44331.1 DUF262 domain-containing protein [Clostridium botulinum]NFL88592.1 DUF262 domain-containing protein [Clostridium botulinum]